MEPFGLFVATSFVLLSGFVIWVLRVAPDSVRGRADIGFLGGFGLVIALFALSQFRPDLAGTLNPVCTMLLLLLWVGALIAAVTLRDRRMLFAFCLAWLVPGLGHLYLRRPAKAVFFLIAIMSLYAAGLWLSSFRMVGFDDNPYYYVGQFGSGTTLLFGQLLSFEKAFPREGFSMLWFDPGLLYVSVAGLLNWIVALNVFESTPEQGRKNSGGGGGS